MYWNPSIETLPPEKLKELQLQRLKDTVRRARQSPFYRQRLAQAGVSADAIRSLEDVHRIPFTTKDDLRSHGLEMLTCTREPLPQAPSPNPLNYFFNVQALLSFPSSRLGTPRGPKLLLRQLGL